MRRVTCFVLCLAAVSGAISHAAIVSVDCQTQGEGVAIHSWAWDKVTYDLTLNETLTGGEGTVLASFTTDDYADPIVWIRKSVENDTAFAWTDYHIAPSLGASFEILDVATPAGWTYTITDPAFGDEKYAGSVDYHYAGLGTEVPVSQFGDFGIKVAFLGSVEFCIQQVPTPEPASLVLLLTASACLLKRRFGTTSQPQAAARRRLGEMVRVGCHPCLLQAGPSPQPRRVACPPSQQMPLGNGHVLIAELSMQLVAARRYNNVISLQPRIDTDVPICNTDNHSGLVSSKGMAAS